MANTPTNIGTSVLRDLHRILRQLTDLRERFDRGPRQSRAADANVQRCEELLAKTKAESKTMRMAADQKQLQLKSSEDKVKDLRRKLNAATSNREYQALLDQISADEMSNSVLADEILEALEKSDAFHKNIVQAEATLAAAKQKAEQVRVEVAQQGPKLQAEVEKFEAELRQTEEILPGDILELYQRIVRQKGEDALALVENQFCGGCNQQIPLNMLGQIMLGQPISCKTCGRLLYLPEKPEKKPVPVDE
jgi:predicted  nucleic acid-binding Zn-ribbon protein